LANIVIFGNSGAGKSTLAKRLADSHQLAHLDLDTIAWLPKSPPQRMSLDQSSVTINEFVKGHKNWVIEGCYSDLLSIVLPYASEIIFLNLPIADCISNAKARPWEPHKYASKAEQDANLAMLIDWIAQYTERQDTFSYHAHRALFDEFVGDKKEITSNR